VHVHICGVAKALVQQKFILLNDYGAIGLEQTQPQEPRGIAATINHLPESSRTMHPEPRSSCANFELVLRIQICISKDDDQFSGDLGWDVNFKL
jgi:hypothetical protein